MAGCLIFHPKTDVARIGHAGRSDGVRRYDVELDPRDYGSDSDHAVRIDLRGVRTTASRHALRLKAALDQNMVALHHARRRRLGGSGDDGRKPLRTKVARSSTCRRRRIDLCHGGDRQTDDRAEEPQDVANHVSFRHLASESGRDIVLLHTENGDRRHDFCADRPVASRRAPAPCEGFLGRTRHRVQRAPEVLESYT